MKKRGESGRGGRERRKRRTVILTWSLVLGLVATVGLGLAVWLGLRSSPRKDVGAVVGKVVEKRVESEFESPSEAEALDFVKRALAIRDPAKVAEYFHPGEASRQDVIGFLGTMEAKDGRSDGFVWLSSMDANGILIDGVLVKTILDGMPRNRLAFLTPDDKGRWKLDFDSFARTVEPSWSGLLEGGVMEGTVRVIVAADTYYNGPFRDDREWVCYGMVSPDTKILMMGYCRKDSPQARAMKQIVEAEDVPRGSGASGKSPRRATLRLRRMEGAESRQFEISSVIAEDWVVSAVPFDAKFK